MVLDYALIFGKFGCLALGFNGAAWASVAAEAIGMVAVLLIIQFNGLTKRFGLFRDMRIHGSELRLLLTQSSPLIMQYAISIISWEYFFILVSHHGRLSLDISQFMRVIIGFLGVFIWSFASTTNTMVSNVIGQGTGNTRTNLMIEAITIIAYSIYVYLTLEYFFLPITIGWMSEWLYWALTFSMSYAYLRSGRWKGKEV